MEKRSINQVTLHGIAACDVEVTKNEETGSNIHTFSLMIDCDGGSVEFFRIQKDDQKKITEGISLKKGQEVTVIGRLSNYSFVDHLGTKKYGTDIQADKVLVF